MKKLFLQLAGAALLGVCFSFFLSSFAEYMFVKKGGILLPDYSVFHIKDGGSGEEEEEFILKKNIFAIDVKPVSKKVFEKKTVRLATRVPSSDIKILGTVIGKKRSYAFVKINNKLVLISSTHSVEGIKLISIGKNSVVLEKDGKRFEIPYSTQKSFAGGKKKVAGNVKSKLGTGRKVIKIARSEVLKQFNNINEVIRTVYIKPFFKHGRFLGYKIVRLSRSSFLRKLGLRSGDVVVRINGEDLSNPEKFFDLMGELSELDAVTVDIIRGGKQKTLFIEIEG